MQVSRDGDTLATKARVWAPEQPKPPAQATRKTNPHPPPLLPPFTEPTANQGLQALKAPAGRE
jgi:hypothetical protein